MSRSRRARVGAFIGVMLAALALASTAGAAFGPGSAGLGDPFFPLAGNGGYDVFTTR